MILFGAPWVFWILGPVFVLWIFAWLALEIRGRKRAALRFSSLDELDLPGSKTFAFFRFLARALRVATLGLLLFVLARTQLQQAESKIYAEGIDIRLAVDTSGSMNGRDLDADRPIRERRTRLEVVKAVVERFVSRRPADQIGLVVFGSWAFTQCPLTLDHGILARFLDELEIGVAGRSTAIGDALGVAVKRLRNSTAESRVLILLTDGKNTAGKLDPIKAAEIAKTYGIRIYTIGAGARGDPPVIDIGLLGPRVTTISADIDDETLTKIAQTTGGTYFRAEDVGALADVYDQIDEMEKTENEREQLYEYEELYERYLAAGLILLLLELVLLATRLRTIP
ncbi:MAG: VWA domain-containing protein [Myxococcota bacterium]